MPLTKIQLRKPIDYARKLSVHINHLNNQVHSATGKSTTQHINERLLNEAKSLLNYTNYSIIEIADGLGFQYQSYFNRFFKKYVGNTPMEYRKNFDKYK